MTAGVDATRLGNPPHPVTETTAARGLRWPTGAALRTYLVWGISWELVFFVVYFGCNWLTAQRPTRLHLYFPWELRIPFVPWMIWVYLSVFVLYLAPLFQMDPAAMRRLARQMLIGTVVSGCIFLLLPAELGFSRTEAAGGYAGVYDTLYAVALPHNLVPSLHIVLTTLVVLALMDASAGMLRYLYGAWLALISLSVLLVHQHHVADVASGYALAVLLRNWIPSSVRAGGPARVTDSP